MDHNEMKEIKLELEPKTAEGTYANLVVIAHSDCEFILDFAKFLPGTQNAKVHSRIIMTPKHAKILLKSLEQNLANFEENYGEIELGDAVGPGPGKPPIIVN